MYKYTSTKKQFNVSTEQDLPTINSFPILPIVYMLNAYSTWATG